MPQMAPLNWLTLLTYFSFILMMWSTMIFYIFMKHPKSKSLKTYFKKSNWKW